MAVLLPVLSGMCALTCHICHARYSAVAQIHSQSLIPVSFLLLFFLFLLFKLRLTKARNTLYSTVSEVTSIFHYQIKLLTFEVCCSMI